MDKKMPKVGEGDDKIKKAKRVQKKKVCQFCVDKAEQIDYKDVTKLRRYITEKGKIIPRRISGVCAMHQRGLTTAIKRARYMVLLPFKAE
ncbi:MAG: 30S ribosomal protein S18 [Clostridia bacterium]|nr:30S ribosomal protein S18 [Clostridia bacterium]